MARRGQSGSLAARPAPSRPTPSASFLESGCHRLPGKGMGEGALGETCYLLPGSFLTPALTSPPEGRGLGKGHRCHPELEVKLMSCSGHFLPHSCIRVK